MSTVAAVSERHDSLLGPASQRLEVALFGARTAAVLRRLVEGTDLDSEDLSVLDEASSILDASAETVERIGRGDALAPSSAFSFGAMALTVELARPTVGTDEAAKSLREMAARIQKLKTVNEMTGVDALIEAFSTLADVATAQAGTEGEGGGFVL